MTTSTPSIECLETALLLRCAAVGAAGDGSERIAELLEADLDWSRLLRLALHHGLLAALHHGLHHAVPLIPPEPARTYLARHFESNLRRNAGLALELRRLLDDLDRSGVAAVPGRAALPLDGRREIVDLDLLIQRRDVARASDVLRADGYVLEHDLWRPRTAWMLRWDGHARFARDHHPIVTVHWRCSPPSGGFAIGVEQLWDPIPRPGSGGAPIRALSPPAALCLHAIRGTVNRWYRLAWLRDLTEVLATADDTQLRRALTTAHRLGCRRALGLGITLASRLFGVPAPRDVIAELGRDRRLADAARQLQGELLDGEPARPGGRNAWRFHLQMVDRERDRLAYVSRRVLTPTLADVAAVPLPARLSSLQYLVRPVRLLVAARRWVWTPRRLRSGDLARFGRTPPHVITRMLALAGVGPGDVVYDLGCGDGRVVISAACQRGSRGVGVDVDADLVALARATARRQGLEQRVEFRHEDARTTDVSAATVVFLYLSVAGTRALRGSLTARLRPGTRLVSLNFDMGDWLPDAAEVVDEASWGMNTIYLWRVPAVPAAAAPDPRLKAPPASRS